MTQNKVENGSKLSISNFIYKNRHFLAFVTILVFVFVYGITAEASEGDIDAGTGSYTSTSNFRESLGIEEGTSPQLDMDSMLSYYQAAGNDTQYITMPAFDTNGNETWRYNDSNASGNKFITSVTVGSTTVTFPDNAYYLNAYAWNSASSQQFFYNSRVSGSGHFAIVQRTDPGTTQGAYVVSDAPFVAGSTRYMAYFDRIRTVYIDNVDTPNSAGFYVWNPYYPSSTSVTNLPVFLASTDGASGYTTFTPTETDFSFDNDNFDFNNLRAQNLITDPNPPAPEPVSDGYEHNMYLNATEKMMQIYSSSYNGKFFPDTDRISIAYNNFISQNQDKYKIKITYSSDMKGTAIAPNAFYNDYSFDEHFEVVKYVSLTDFVNGTYDVNMGTELSKAPATIGGVLSGATSNGVYRLMSNELQTSDFSSFIGMLGDRFGLGMPMDGENFYYNYWSGERSHIPSDFTWEKHDFKVKINLVYSFNLVEETSVGYYEKTYDVLDWNSSQLNNNDLNSNYNPQYDENGNPIILPSDNGSSLAGGTSSTGSGGVSASGGSALAYVAPNAVNVTVNSGGSLTPAFQIDDVNIANVAQTMNDVVSFFGNDRNENGFWGLMKSVYDFLPEGIWSAIAIGVSTVLGISIVKVTLSYFRK